MSYRAFVGVKKIIDRGFPQSSIGTKWFGAVQDQLILVKLVFGGTFEALTFASQ